MIKLQQITDLMGFTKSGQSISETTDRTPTKVDPETLGPKEVYMTWQAPSRPAKSGFNSKLNRTFMIIGIVIALILVILQEFFLIFVIASLIFVTHVLSETPPDTITYEVSSHGLMVDGNQYYWQEMRRFFFVDEEGHHSVVIDMLTPIPPRLYITINENDREKLKDMFVQKIHFLESQPQSFLDKTYQSVLDKFNS